MGLKLQLDIGNELLGGTEQYQQPDPIDLLLASEELTGAIEALNNYLVGYENMQTIRRIVKAGRLTNDIRDIVGTENLELIASLEADSKGDGFWTKVKEYFRKLWEAFWNFIKSIFGQGDTIDKELKAAANVITTMTPSAVEDAIRDIVTGGAGTAPAEGNTPKPQKPATKPSAAKHSSLEQPIPIINNTKINAAVLYADKLFDELEDTCKKIMDGGPGNLDPADKAATAAAVTKSNNEISRVENKLADLKVTSDGTSIVVEGMTGMAPIIIGTYTAVSEIGSFQYALKNAIELSSVMHNLLNGRVAARERELTGLLNKTLPEDYVAFASVFKTVMNKLLSGTTSYLAAMKKIAQYSFESKVKLNRVVSAVVATAK